MADQKSKKPITEDTPATWHHLADRELLELVFETVAQMNTRLTAVETGLTAVENHLANVEQAVVRLEEDVYNLKLSNATILATARESIFEVRKIGIQIVSMRRELD